MERTTKIVLWAALGVVAGVGLCAVGLVAGVGLGMAIGARAGHDGPHDSRSQAAAGRLLCEPAPDLALPTLEGHGWRLTDQRGKVVVLDFWATWCVPCRKALPQVKKLWELRRARTDFVLAGVPLEADEKAVLAFCKDEAVGWPQLMTPGSGWDQNAFASAFSVESIPNLVVLDQKGRIAGWRLSPEDAASLVDALLAGKNQQAPEAAPPLSR